RGQWVVGDVDQRRIEYASRNLVSHWDAVLRMGPQYMNGSPGRAYAFETQSWLLFHFLANVHPRETDAFVGRLLSGMEPSAAFAVDFEITSRSLDEQIELARRAALLHPDDPRAVLLLAERLPPGLERHAAIERALHLAPGDPDALRLAAFDSLEGDRLAEGLDRARRAQQAASTNPRALDVLAAALAVNGRCEEAALVEARAIEVLPDGTPEATVHELQDRA